jgi:hypothetical protein
MFDFHNMHAGRTNYHHVNLVRLATATHRVNQVRDYYEAGITGFYLQSPGNLIECPFLAGIYKWGKRQVIYTHLQTPHVRPRTHPRLGMLFS